MRLISLVLCLSICVFADSSVTAGVLTERYLNCQALIYGISVQTEEKLSTESRVQKIVEAFDEARTSPTVQKLLVASVLNGNSDVSPREASTTASIRLVSSLSEYSRLLTEGEPVFNGVFSPVVLEFMSYVSPFEAAQQLQVPFPSFFDDSYTSYVIAGLKEELTGEDLNQVKSMVLDNFSNFDFKVTPTYSLLASFYINQTDDVDFVKHVWENFPFERSLLLERAAHARTDSNLAKLGLELTRELYTSCPKETNDELPLEWSAGKFLLLQMEESSAARSLARDIVRNPRSFHKERAQLLFGLTVLPEANPGIEPIRQSIEREINMLQAVLND